MTDTICAVATPPGRGGIGIVRVSGTKCEAVAKAITGAHPAPRKAILTRFVDVEGEVIDTGILVFYPQPNSYTGEDVLEFQGHGSPVVQQQLVDVLLAQGVRTALPGEFTQRAFLNDKLDLAQAEAVADLIASGSREAARAATRSLQGDFSRVVNTLDADLLKLRVYMEGALDFAEEEIDFLSSAEQTNQLQRMIGVLEETLQRVTTGVAMQQGLEVAIAGKPNVGKSSLLNALLGEDRAIVTATAGTTRDLLDGELSLDGLPIRLVDTAGLHASDDPIEAEGMRRAQEALKRADVVLWVVEDCDAVESSVPSVYKDDAILIRNKCDLSGRSAGQLDAKEYRLSAKTGEGIEALCAGLKALAGFQTGTDAFAGRPRHVHLLNQVLDEFNTAYAQLQIAEGELVAENLRLAHERLGEIVGVTTSDDLLGEIFSTFCIGK